MNIDHNDYKPLPVLTVQNTMGSAIAALTSAPTKRNLEVLKFNCSKLLCDYLYNTSLKISKTSVLELQIFLKIRNPIFKKIHHGEIFHVHDYTEYHRRGWCALRIMMKRTGYRADSSVTSEWAGWVSMLLMMK